jgi:Protein of unknown function (DUF1214)
VLSSAIDLLEYTQVLCGADHNQLGELDMTDGDATSDPMIESTRNAQRWVTEFTDAISHAAGEVVFADKRIENPLAQAEGLRYLTRCLSFAALNMVENNDPAYPHISPLLSPWLQWALPNPDYNYLTAPVHGDYEYRVFGRLGTARFFLVEVYAGVHEKIEEFQVFSSRGDFEVGPDGGIEIILSRQRPAGTSNWVELPDGGAYVFLRQAYYDWENEVAGDLNIERLGATYPPPPVDAAMLNERLNSMVEFMRRTTVTIAKSTGRFYDVPPDKMDFPPFPLGKREHGNQVGIRGQFYGQGQYRCGPDEAIILEVTPPDAKYWMFGLVSQYMEALDWHERQTSINGHQAVLDEDGVFRAVIAHRDPGVPNWLDTGGREVNLLAGRYYLPKTEPVPIPTLRAVPFAELREHLPPGTPSVTPEQRSDWLRRRMLSVRRRLAGF